jgi:hypothetical protein
MNDKEKAKLRCDAILKACFGPEIAANWWSSPNKAFNMLTPNEMWESVEWALVYNYLLGQLNGDYS